jgi:hypothetical protein
MVWLLFMSEHSPPVFRLKIKILGMVDGVGKFLNQLENDIMIKSLK